MRPLTPRCQVTLHGTLLAVQLVALWLVIGPSLESPGFPLDDAWIHQVIARTFAETGTLGYDVERFGSGATSWLWPVILALNPATFDVSPVYFAVGLGALAHVVAGQLVLRMLLADGFERGVALLGAALFSTAGNGVWFAASGMESSFIVMLSCLAVHASFRNGIRWKLVTGLLLAFAFLTRPECFLLTPVLFGAALLRGQRQLKCFLALLAPVVASVVLFVLFNLVHTGSAKPSTLSGRKWMWLAHSEGWSVLERVQSYGLVWVERLHRYTLGFENPIALWLALGLAGVGAFEIVRRGAKRVSVLSFWALLHLATYAVLLPTPGHGGRYQPLTPCIFLLLVGFGVVSIGRSLVAGASARWPNAELPPLLARTVTAITGIPIALFALLVDRDWGHAHALAVKHVNDTEVAMGQSLNQLPPQANVASFDIGGIGYFAERRVLDLGGLVDPNIISRVKQGDTADLLIERGVDYVVLPLGYSNEFPDPWNFAERLALQRQRQVQLTLLFERASIPEVWTPGIKATWHSAPRQGLFRVEANRGQ